MKEFKNRLAVITGAGTGMGRELAIKLAAEGCHVAMCDVLMDHLAVTEAAARKTAADNVLVTAHECDVSDENQVLALCQAVKEQHNTEKINLLFNNAGIAGVGSFILDAREDWERVFNIDWFGVYYSTRAFMPMLLASEEGHIINTSSVNGFWACSGPFSPHTSYSSAKFAVKGFSEALLVDLRVNAPHVKVSLVMPGHIGTPIILNTPRILGYTKSGVAEATPEEIKRTRERLTAQGIPIGELSDEELLAAFLQQAEGFRDNAPLTSADGAQIILDGVREEKWRILVGEDAHDMDRIVRESPEEAYDESIIIRLFDAAEARGVDIKEQKEAYLQTLET